MRSVSEQYHIIQNSLKYSKQTTQIARRWTNLVLHAIYRNIKSARAIIQDFGNCREHLDFAACGLCIVLYN